MCLNSKIITDLQLYFHKIFEVKSLRFYNKLLNRLLCNKKGKVVAYGKAYIVNPQNIVINGEISINHGAYINAYNPIYFGDDVTVSAGASIVSTGLDLEKFSNGEKSHIDNDGIHIGNHVWIGCNASIIGNVKITGEFVVIGAGAVVNKDIKESYTVWAGVPAKMIKRLF